MPDYKPDTTTNKLILLLIFEKMEIPLTENSIMDICTNKNTWLKYMDCKEYLAQLVDAKLLYCALSHNSQLYSITYEGRTCLSMFYKQIPISIREDITNFAKNNIQHIKRMQEYTSDYQKMSDGSYLFIMVDFVRIKIYDIVYSRRKNVLEKYKQMGVQI